QRKLLLTVPERLRANGATLAYSKGADRRPPRRQQRRPRGTPPVAARPDHGPAGRSHQAAKSAPRSRSIDLLRAALSGNLPPHPRGGGIGWYELGRIKEVRPFLSGKDDD